LIDLVRQPVGFRVSGRLSSRIGYVALAAGTIALGLWVHRGGAGLGATARDALGDALWGAMMEWWVGAAAPGARLMTRSGVTLGFCLTVELSQLIHGPAIDAVRRTTLGNLALGSGFDWRDLLAYTAGVAVAAGVERLVRGRLRRAGQGKE
jgi:hypothetical protein